MKYKWDDNSKYKDVYYHYNMQRITIVTLNTINVNIYTDIKIPDAKSLIKFDRNLKTIPTSKETKL